jgi:hypothetical protein
MESNKVQFLNNYEYLVVLICNNTFYYISIFYILVIISFESLVLLKPFQSTTIKDVLFKENFDYFQKIKFITPFKIKTFN